MVWNNLGLGCGLNAGMQYGMYSMSPFNPMAGSMGVWEFGFGGDCHHHCHSNRNNEMRNMAANYMKGAIIGSTVKNGLDMIMGTIDHIVNKDSARVSYAPTNYGMDYGMGYGMYGMSNYNLTGRAMQTISQTPTLNPGSSQGATITPKTDNSTLTGADKNALDDVLGKEDATEEQITKVKNMPKEKVQSYLQQLVDTAKATGEEKSGEKVYKDTNGKVIATIKYDSDHKITEIELNSAKGEKVVVGQETT